LHELYAAFEAAYATEHAAECGGNEHELEANELDRTRIFARPQLSGAPFSRIAASE
jgi:hypothetical protein